MMTDGSGRISPDSFAYYDRATRCWKTSQASLPLTEDTRLGRSSPTWPTTGTMRNGTVYPQPPLVPRTSATGSSSSPSYPTPRSTDADRGGRGDLLQSVRGNPNTHYKLWRTPTAVHSRGSSGGRNRRGDLRDMARRWPTPTHCDWKGSGPTVIRKDGKDRRQDRLDYAAEQADSSTPPSAASGSLNPTWVEWLMGFPIGWTVLKVSATPSSRRSPNG
jgi:hypothetical protein